MLSLLVYALTTLSFKFSGSHDPHDLFKPVAVTAERAWNLWGWIWVPGDTSRTPWGMARSTEPFHSRQCGDRYGPT
jgi:hypothetical protein